jgi:ParB family chromosome partitioning protein
MSTGAKGLGRGFDSLIPTSFDTTILMDESERIQMLSVDVLKPNPDQPRKHFDDQAIKELSLSIKQYGLLQPIIVTPAPNGSYYIVAGERRTRAAKLVGLKTIPTLVRTSEELERLEIALVENVQRVDLSPLEQAASILRLHDQFNVDYETIATRLGKAQATISNMVRLLGLPPEAQQALTGGKITEGHARAILAFKDKHKQLELLQLIITKHWTVRQAEQYVTAHKSGVKDQTLAKARTETTTPETKTLTKLLKTPVTIKRTAKGGKLEISFRSDQELADIIKRISL